MRRRSSWPLAFMPALVLLAYAGLQLTATDRTPPTTTSTSVATTSTTVAPAAWTCQQGGFEFHTGTVEAAKIGRCHQDGTPTATGAR